MNREPKPKCISIVLSYPYFSISYFAFFNFTTSEIKIANRHRKNLLKINNLTTEDCLVYLEEQWFYDLQNASLNIYA